MVPGEYSAEPTFAGFNLYPIGMNHHPPHHFSEEVLQSNGGGGEPLGRLFQGCCYELLSQCRNVFWQAEHIHDVLGGLQKGPAPKEDLPLNLMGRQSSRFARYSTTVRCRLANVIAVPFTVLQCMGRDESIALGVP